MVVARTPYAGPWLNNAAAQLRIVPQVTTEAYLQAIAELRGASPRGRVVVAAEAVGFFDGLKLDIPAIHKAAKTLPDGILAVDVSQWWGEFKAAEFADLVFITGNKWLLADHGVAVTWVHPDLLPRLAPADSWQHGGKNKSGGMEAMLNGIEGPKPWGPLWTLRHSSQYLVKLGGLAAIHGHVAPLVSLATRLLHEGGLPLLSPLDEARQSGNVCFGQATLAETEACFEDLWNEAGVVLSHGGAVARLRLTPYAYTSEDDVRAAVPRILRHLARNGLALNGPALKR